MLWKIHLSDRYFCIYCKLPCSKEGYHDSCKRDMDLFYNERKYPITFLSQSESDVIGLIQNKWIEYFYGNVGKSINEEKAQELIIFLYSTINYKPKILISKSLLSAQKIAYRLKSTRGVIKDSKWSKLEKELLAELKEKVDPNVEHEIFSQIVPSVHKSIIDIGLESEIKNARKRQDHYFNFGFIGHNIYPHIANFDYYREIKIISNDNLVDSRIFGTIYLNDAIILSEFPIVFTKQEIIFSDGYRYDRANTPVLL